MISFAAPYTTISVHQGKYPCLCSSAERLAISYFELYGTEVNLATVLLQLENILCFGLSKLANPTDAAVTVVMAQEKNDPILFARFSIATPPPTTIIAEIHAVNRENPSVKCTSWALERLSYEKKVSKSSGESLMVDKFGNVKEGLSSNFFVVKKNCLQTADVDLVLNGQVRKIIIDLCQENNITVDQTPPNLLQIEEWEGCFVCSTPRIIQEISLLEIDKSLKEEFPLLHFPKKFEENPICEKLRNLVKGRMSILEV
eukprot:GHVP01059369.1.p1 GENE.GHVP01059369.1~~GHVP01059369.1.p1  ORF type:complete len:258 (-),score=47.83 GHVP01059369.1:276-1049(-)